MNNGTSSRGAVGGCNTPSNRVDPWWNPGPLFPAVTTSGPLKIDERSPENQHNYCEQQRNTSIVPVYSFLSAPSLQHQSYHHDSEKINKKSCSTISAIFTTSSSTFTSFNEDSLSRCSNIIKPSSKTLPHPYDVPISTTIQGQLKKVLTNLHGPKSSDSTDIKRSTDQLLTTNSTVPTCSLTSTSTSLGCATSSSTTTSTSASIRNTSLGTTKNSIDIPSLSPSSSSRESITGILSSLNVRVKAEDKSDTYTNESLSTTSGTGFCGSLLNSLLSTSKVSTTKHFNENRQRIEQFHNLDQTLNIKVEYSLNSSPSCCGVLESGTEAGLVAASPYDIINNSISRSLSKIDDCCIEKSDKQSSDIVVSPQSEIAIDMKYETQTGPPGGPPHLTSTGVEPPHSSQGSGLVVSASPTEVVGVESLLLPWGTTGADFLEPSDVKQTAAGIQDAWDTLLLGSSVGVATAQSLAELKPLPPFTGYTGHLSINGIPGHHYHTIASSAQRPSMHSSSPQPSSNQEYYESPVVSSSTPCPSATQKQHQHQHQHQAQQHQLQQQLPQSTQQVDYDIEDIAEIIGSAIADTTVPGGGNEPESERDPDASRDWIDIAEWIDNPCSPKAHEVTSPSPYSQIYASTNPINQSHQHGSTLQSLLTTGYAPLLQARLQAGNTGLQNASCGETPSSTSPYPPVSPPGRVSTSCSPDHLLHSSFAAPSHPRKRSRPTSANQSATKKNSVASALSYGTESGVIGGKEKPVHRCSICNRGFLNKSNIKVHLRTHTGEKPFRCEVCGKAFRQKAHLIKHQQIHKRIGRD
ncbi:hypothetical protein PV327_007395 [Microctonus hyperodae]|uniref:C2H2-type domain-containing protein n=1 Tax=Microctonus hyperodae TaxID=165561 RepID=A0AA39KYJ5_MICHY|nr:hypothetical protein PV327_007395 [Microctonus hyperodae]